MKELTTHEALFVSGANNSTDTLNNRLDNMASTGFTLLVLGYMAEKIFAGYAGCHVASNPSINNPSMRVVLGMGAALMTAATPYAVYRIFDHYYSKSV